MTKKPENNLMDKIVSLAKRRGFVFPGSEIYGGLANSWDYGPLGVELKNNIKKLWWKMFVHNRDDMVGVDAAIIMNPKVWEASGHLKKFTDLLVECKKCHMRFRPEDLENPKKCPNCGGDLTEPRQFRTMFKTFIGPVEDQTSEVYLRPETAPGIFVNFKNFLNTTRKTIPFGVAQIGKAFRNEITPGNFIFRIREFEQMEIEYFIPEPESDKDWQKYFDYWRDQMFEWMKAVGIDVKKVHENNIPKEELAHYSKKTIDFEYEFPFGRKELYGLAYRTDFDLKNHEQFSGQNLKYKDPETGKEYWPHVIEPSLGVDRTFLAVLLSAYSEDGDPTPVNASAGKRVVLKLKPQLAPYKAAVFPLLANKPGLVKKAREVYKMLKFSTSHFSPLTSITWDDRGNIGKRYYSQDEIGTPYCITVDFDSLENEDVTVRDRDTTKQERVKISKLKSYLLSKISES